MIPLRRFANISTSIISPSEVGYIHLNLLPSKTCVLTIFRSAVNPHLFQKSNIRCIALGAIIMYNVANEIFII
jgi:hypothetical protein